MHPILIAELANDRQAELVRQVESFRRAARPARRRTLLAGVADSITSARGRHRRGAAATTWSAPADPCCA